MTYSNPNYPETPEHEKLEAIVDKSQAIGEFLDWMGQQGIHRGEYSDDYYDGQFMFTSTKSITTLLEEHFGIDPVALDAEKRAIIMHHLDVEAQAEEEMDELEGLT